MFKVLTVRDLVRVPPTRFDLELSQSLKESLQDVVEGKIYPDVGIFLVVTDILSIGDGKIVPEDGAIYYPVDFKAVVYVPELNEIVIGEVVDITEFGVFVRIGMIDALVHVSQIMDDKVSYDGKNSIFSGKKTNLKLKEGDIVRARIVGVSIGKGHTKISLTMRQPCLGAMEWLTRDKKKEVKVKVKEKVVKEK